MLNAYGYIHKYFIFKCQHLFVLSIFRPFSLLKGLLTAVIYQLSSLFLILFIHSLALYKTGTTHNVLRPRDTVMGLSYD